MPIDPNITFSYITANNGMITSSWDSEGNPEPPFGVNQRDYYAVNCDPLTVKCKPTFVLEKNITVIKKGPTAPPTLEMFPYEEGTDVVNLANEEAVINSSFYGSDMFQSWNFREEGSSWPPPGNPPAYKENNTHGTAFDFQDISMFYNSAKELLKPGDEINVPIDVADTGEDWKINDQIVIEHEFTDSFGNLKLATARIQIMDLDPLSKQNCIDPVLPNDAPVFACVKNWGVDTAGSPANSIGYWGGDSNWIIGKVMSITGNFPQEAITDKDLYTVSLVQSPPLFEVKFPKFSYRYKYEDGEYSVFGPWSEIAFIPGDFDYLPKKGYNLGMQNNLRTLNIKNWVPKNIPKDVVQVDILYKESNSPNVYTVSSHKKDDPAESGGDNYWNAPGTGGSTGNYPIKSELIHKVVASNQMLRPWDNVPRRALAQEITANRLIFANYVQNFDLKDSSLDEIKVVFAPTLETNDFSIDATLDTTGTLPFPGLPAKSLKSMRTYQLGVVYRDRYGRETPVLTSKSGSIKLPKLNAKLQNRLSVELKNNPPYWAESYTFYIKETSNEYYNLAMDRWYDAEDGGIWLSFPSSERNKITDTTNLILKKQHDTHVFTDYDTKYKVLSIKNNAPTFIKTTNKYWGSLPMTLFPPGWGHLGTWDSGMFYNTGLPLPNRMFIDIYAEYWDQSSLAELSSMAGAQIRIVQSDGASSAYNAATTDTTNKTRWYDISKISTIGSPPQVVQEEVQVGTVTTVTEVELPGQDEQLVRISLEKAFGDDAAFCEPSSSSAASLDKGLSIEARTKIVRDKSEFEGRFFVKVLRDANVELNIVQPQQVKDDQYQILFTKKLRYLNFAQPGVQDWSNKQIETDGSSHSLRDPNTNYISLGESKGNRGPYGLHPTTAQQTANGSTKYVSGGIDSHANRLVSSLSNVHSDGTWYINSDGYDGQQPAELSIWPIDGRRWPFGPGDATAGLWETSLGNQFDDYLANQNGGGDANFWPAYGLKNTLNPNYPDGGGTFIGADATSYTPGMPGDEMVGIATNAKISKGVNEWPSYGAGIYWRYNPYMLVRRSDSNATINDRLNGEGGTGLDLHDITGTPLKPGPSVPYEDRAIKDKNGVDNILSSAMLELRLDGNKNYTPKPGAPGQNNYLYGANPYNIPATFGNQEDFLRTFPKFDSGTHTKLREDWYYLFHGSTKVNDEWPRGSFSPNRWFIDKCGAAQGYCGNGIWDDGNSGYMDISFYGIGSKTSTNRHDNFEDILRTENFNEAGFMDAIKTIGTQFRFKYDPDQVVYTITNVKQSGTGDIPEIYNYEAPQGRWGVKDGKVYVGGDGIGWETEPPYGGTDLEGGRAFISDIWGRDSSSARQDDGGSLINKRIRWTLTLDKVIGSEGVHGFNPITKHVDAEGKANIESDGSSGRNIYSYDTTQHDSGHIIAEKGGTPADIEFYNLNSYWNASDNAGHTSSHGTKQQNDINHAFYGANTNAYIGLHERGLNNTEIQIVTPYRGEERDIPMSNNPAIWETEPLEDVGLDIYYAASPTYPVNLTRYRDDGMVDMEDTYGANWYDYSLRGEEVIKVGSVANNMVGQTGNTCSGCKQRPVVCDVQGDVVWFTPTKTFTATGLSTAFFDPQLPTGPAVPKLLQNGDKIRFNWRGEGTFYGVGRDDEYIEFEIEEALSHLCYRLKTNTHANKRGLGYFNCWSYGTGVETNRLRDDFNAITVDKGVKASMPLATPYEEERRSSGLIFSGIYNSTSGVNETNQFIQAEPITKDLNPVTGSIQKLFARDTDLVTFCENKVFKILANKDALFNAGGNSQLTSTNKVLGATMPFSGDYGISTNPESFASESYRVYFTDKYRGAVLRLSRDGLTPISDAGMKDWFKDNLRFATALIGSYDTRDDQYNLTIETADENGREKAYTLSYTEARRGWVSFKSFIQQSGISHKNIYYTTPSNRYSAITLEDPWGVSYSTPAEGLGEMWQHSLDLRIKRLVDTDVSNSSAVTISSGSGAIIVGMVVEGDGIPIDTVVTEVNSNTSVTLNNNCYLEDGDELTFTTARNNFYGNTGHYSMVKTLFNGAKGAVKRFKSLDYEGTQAKTLPEFHNQYQIEGQNVGQIYYDNYPKIGWYVENIETDIQEGKISEFINKENKWFNYIRGKDGGADVTTNDSVDTGEFSLQGLGYESTLPAPTGCLGCDESGADTSVPGCCDPNAINTTIGATCDDGSCIALVYGCTDDGNDPNFPGRPTGYIGQAFNYYAGANTDDGSCLYFPGCTDPLASNYDSSADIDDGSCTYGSVNCNDPVSIPDDNFEQVLIDLGLDTGSPDGSVPLTDVSTLTTLTYFGPSQPTYPNNLLISDMTGIECFTSLETLNIPHHDFTNLNLIQNTNLTNLQCASNQYLTSITFPSSLEYVNVINTGVASLDFSTCNNLVYLTGNANANLTFLDLRNGNNQNLNLLGPTQTGQGFNDCPNLMNILVDDPTWSSNNWPSSTHYWNSGAQFCSGYNNGVYTGCVSVQ